MGMQDYDILFGLLACQLRLLSKRALAHTLLAREDDTPLAESLLTNKVLLAADHALLIQLVENIIHAHHGNVREALETFGGDKAVEEAFSHTVSYRDDSWHPSDDKTILATELPHGLPIQIAPEPVGRYTGGSEYARGGIGRILLVHDEQLGRDVILKELLPHLNVNPTASTLSQLPPPDSPASPMRQSAAMMARFLQEAKITGQLAHPSIVPVYELGLRADGQLYYTMKLVRGDTLSVAIKSYTTNDDRLRLLRPFLDVCQAMAYAHAKGVIHRDLKPSNIMVGEFGECVVLDWGLAKTLRDTDAHQEAMEKTLSQLKLAPDKLDGLKTGSRDVLGTPLYMAPEQARGQADDLGFHSDVYSLGVVLYEILSGDLPHAWTNSRDTILRVGTRAAPSVKKVAPATPPELAAICDKALKFNPEDRYPSARELANDIARFLEGAVVDAYAYRATDILRRLYRQHRTALHVAGVAALMLLVVGVASYINIYQAREDAEAAQVLAEQERTVAEEQRTVADAQRRVAEEQRTRAETAEEETAWEKYVSDIRLADTYIKSNRFQAAEDLLFATDTRYRNIEWGYLVAQLYQDEATLTGHTANVFWLETAPDGVTLLSVSGDRSARLWNLESHETLHTWQFSGAQILFGTFDQTGERIALCLDDGRVILVSPESGAILLELAGHTAAANHCAFAATDNSLYSGGNDRSVIHWDLNTGEQRGGLPDHPSAVKQLTLIDNDRRILTETSEYKLRLYDAETSALIGEAEGHNHEYAVEGGVIAAVTENIAVLYQDNDLREIVRLPHEVTVHRCRAYPEANVVLTSAEDGNARAFSYPDGALMKVFKVGDVVKDCQLLPTFNRLIAVSVTGTGAVWEFPGGTEINKFAGHRGRVQRMTLTRDGRQIITGAADSSIRLWSVEDSVLRKTAGRASGRPTNFAVAAASSAYAVTNDQGQILVWNGVDELPVYHAFFQHSFKDTALGLSSDGKLLGLVVDEFLPVIISLPDGKVLARLEGHEGSIKSIQFNTESTEVVTTSWDRTVRIWRVTDGALLTTLEGHNNVTSFARFSPNDQWIASTSQDNTARIWSRETAEQHMEIKHSTHVLHGVFTNNSESFVSVATDGSAQIGQLGTQTEINDFSVPRSALAHVSIEDSGKRLLLTDRDGTIYFVDITSKLNLLDIPPMGERRSNATETVKDNSITFAVNDGCIESTLIMPLDISNAAQAVSFRDSWKHHETALAVDARSNSNQHTFIPQPVMAELIKVLSELGATGSSEFLVSKEFLALPDFWRYGMEPGDQLLLIDGLPPQADHRSLATMLAGTLPPTGVMVKLDLLRNGQALRIQSNVLPLSTSTVVCNLPATQAQALLRAALKVVTRGEAEVLLANRNVAQKLNLELENPDAILGFWIPFFPDALGNLMVQNAKLHSGGRIVRIEGESIVSLDMIRDQLNAALDWIEGSNHYNVSIDVKEGAFLERQITYSGEGDSEP